MNQFVIFILLITAPLIFAEDAIYGCSTKDLELTTTCRPKLTKLTEEMKKNPLSAGFPSVDTLQKMSVHCKEAMECVKPAQCDAIKNRMSKFSGMCDTIDFMKGPYAQCAAKARFQNPENYKVYSFFQLKASKDKTECIQWYFSDKSRMSTEQKCAQFRAKKSCIEKDFGKACGDSTLKSFRENLGYVSKFVGCPVH